MKSSHNLITGGVISKIRNMILRAELKPGHRLVEEAFTRQLGVGRTPVREALLLLQGEGFVARDQRGWEVRGLGGHGLQAVFESRAALEAEASRLAARKMTPRTAAALARLAERMESGTGGDRLELHRTNDEFHLLLVQAADNELLSQFYERTMAHYWALGAAVLFNDEQAAQANRQHRALLEALARGDEEAAGLQAREHVLATWRIVEAFIEAVEHYETISGISSMEAHAGERWHGQY